MIKVQDLSTKVLSYLENWVHTIQCTVQESYRYLWNVNLEDYKKYMPWTGINDKWTRYKYKATKQIRRVEYMNNKP